MKSIGKDRRGDIPITLFVLMIVVLCILTILSFFYSIEDTKYSYIGPGLIETVKSFAEEKSLQSKGFTSADSFESGNMRIFRGAEGIEGEYVQQKIPVLGWGEERTIVRIIYLGR